MQCEARRFYTSTNLYTRPAGAMSVQSVHKHTNQSDVTFREDCPDLHRDFLRHLENQAKTQNLNPRVTSGLRRVGDDTLQKRLDGVNDRVGEVLYSVQNVVKNTFDLIHDWMHGEQRVCEMDLKDSLGPSVGPRPGIS